MQVQLRSRLRSGQMQQRLKQPFEQCVQAKAEQAKQKGEENNNNKKWK